MSLYAGVSLVYFPSGVEVRGRDIIKGANRL